jgi:hypothetical protein
MYTVTAGSCKGGDETVLVQAFPNIHFEFEAGWDFGNNEYELHKPGRWPNTELSAGNTAGAYMQVNLQVDNVDVTASLSCVEDLKKRYRRINEVTSSILRAAEWFTSRLSDVGAASITVQRPKLSFGYKHGWVEDDTTPACGFTVEGSVSGDPLFGISGEADVSNYLFDLCPPLLAAKKGLEKIHAAELKLILSAGANLSGSITATKSLTSRQGNFEGTVGGECELSLQGKADVEGCFCFIHCSAGVSASATAKLTAALEGEWQPRSSKPEVTATISFDGLTIRFVVWGGVGHIDEPAEDEGQGYKFFEDITLYKGKFHPFGEDEAGG